jgi:carbon-monoxide dehydrogenase medium subunit
MTPFEFRTPTSLEEALGLLREHGDDAKLIAGGTALVILMKQRLVRPAVLVSLQRVAELRGVEANDGGVRIGALTTHREAEGSPLVRERLPVLAETLRHVATVRIRNVGTLGGNLAHADPNQDPPPTLIALNATLELIGPNGAREVPVEEFFKDYYETDLQDGEIVQAIRVPGLPARSKTAYTKFLPRTADDYATVAVSVVLTTDESGQRCENARIALGSVGSTPVHATAVEDALRGQQLTPNVIRAAAAAVKDEVDPITDIRGSSEYKRDMAEVWVRRTIERALAS